MSRLALFISSSDARLNSPLRRRLNVAVWAIVAVVAIDVAINVAFEFPSDPKMPPSRLQLYFNYGRSQEGKLRQITRQTANQSAAIALSGWYEPLPVVDLGARPSAPIVTFYGMSHANRLGQALKRVSDEFHIR